MSVAQGSPPVFLTRDEVWAILHHLAGVPRLLALLFYGAGLRLLEAARLRVQDVDFAANLIVVRNGNGAKDRVTMVPAAVKAELATRLADGYGIRTVQELLGHRDVATTMIYTHVLNRGPAAVRSPADRMLGA